MLRLFFRSFGHTDEQLKALARATDGASGSDVEWLTTEIMRRLLLDGRKQMEKHDTDDALARFRVRMETLSDLKSNANGEPSRRAKGGKLKGNAP